MEALAYPRLIGTTVPKYLKQVENMSKKCEDGTMIVDEKFKAWLEKAERINQACGESQRK